MGNSDGVQRMISNNKVKNGNSIIQAVRDRIRLLPAGSVFTPTELLVDFDSYDALRQSLTRLVESGEIQRIRKGYYLRPHAKKAPRRKPSPEAIAQAFARKSTTRWLREKFRGPG